MIISISAKPQNNPMEYKWYTYNSTRKHKIRHSGTTEYIEKGDEIGLLANKNGGKFRLIFAHNPDRVITVEKKDNDAIVRNSKEMRGVPKAISEKDALDRAGGNMDVTKMTSRRAFDADYYKSPTPVRAEGKNGFNFAQYQWRKVAKRLIVHKPNGASVLATYEPGDIIGVRWHRDAIGGYLITIQGEKFGIPSKDEWMEMVTRSPVLPQNLWPRGGITVEQIKANKEHAHEQGKRERKEIRDIEKQQINEAKEAQEALEKENEEDQARKQAAKQEENRQKEQERQRADELRRAPKTAEEVAQHLIDQKRKGTTIVDDVNEDEDYDLTDLDNLDLELDDEEDADPLADQELMDDPEYPEDFDPDERDIEEGKAEEDIAAKLGETKDELREQAKQFDLNNFEEDDDEDVGELDDFDDDEDGVGLTDDNLDSDDDTSLDDDAGEEELSDDPEDSGTDDSSGEGDGDADSTDPDSDGFADEDFTDEENLTDEEDNEDNPDDTADTDDDSGDDTSTDDGDAADPDADGTEESDTDSEDGEEAEKGDSRPSVEEMKQQLIDEEIADDFELEDMDDDEVIETWEEEFGDTGGDNSDPDTAADPEADTEDDPDADPDDDDGSVDGLDDPGIDDDLDGFEDEPDDIEGEPTDAELGDIDAEEGEDFDDDEGGETYEADDGDVVKFKSDATEQREWLILDIFPLPANNNILVYKVYDITNEPEEFHTVRVSVNKKQGFAAMVDFQRKLNGKAFMEYFNAAETYDKSKLPISS